MRSARLAAPRAAAAEAATTVSQEVIDKCVNSIRFLAIDAVNKAKSGHPGLPMGAAPMSYVLFNETMQYNPKNPAWFNRDRFVLSAGHGSMLQYALMHLVGYESVTVSHRLCWGGGQERAGVKGCLWTQQQQQQLERRRSCRPVPSACCRTC